MDEYINKHKAYMMLKDLEATYLQYDVKEAYAKAARRIDQMPKVDVQPVKYGTWENTNTPNHLRCSNCEITHFIAQYPHGAINYCPNCGADMRGDTQ